jgi:hypothetical protein
MKTPALFLLALICASLASPQTTPPAPPRPVEVFSDLDGTWEGTFVGYDEEGVELYRIGVRQTYKTIDDTTQTVEVEDTMPDGTVITGKGRNVARRRSDGTFALTCVVDKSTGERVEHEGRVVRGPDGVPGLVWFSNDKDRSETFRERVRREGTLEVYAIDGMGRYGETRMLMAGRYVKR